MEDRGGALLAPVGVVRESTSDDHSHGAMGVGLPGAVGVGSAPIISQTTSGPVPDYPAPSLTPRDIAAIAEAGCKGGTFQCTLCHKTFGYKNGLIRHVRLTHAGEKPYQCNICNRRFGYKHILMEHQNLHFGNRPYACNLCDKKFAARSNLIQHRMVHKRPFNCSLCNKRFDREDQLKKHMFAHPQSLLTCNFCSYAAASQADLNSHMVEQHSPPVLDTRTNPRRNSADNSVGGGSDYGGNNGGPSEHGDDDSSSHKLASESPPELMSRSISPHHHMQLPSVPNDLHVSNATIPTTIPPPGTPIAAPHMGVGGGAGAGSPPMSGMPVTLGGVPLMYSRLNMDHRAQRVETICNQLSMGGAPPLSPISPNHSSNSSHPAHISSLYIPPSIAAGPLDIPASTASLYSNIVVKKENEEPDSHNDAVVYVERNMSRSSSVGQPAGDYHTGACRTVSPLHSDRSSAYANGHESREPGEPMESLDVHQAPVSIANSHLRDHSVQPSAASISVLPAIHEVFSRRPQRAVSPNFSNFGVPPALPERPSSGDAPMPILSPTPPGSSAPLLSPALNGINSNSARNISPQDQGQSSVNGETGFVLPVSQSSVSGRPTAQLPPIAQVLRNTKDAVVQHAAEIPGFPALEDVLSYYMSQGRLFKCQHCNILFFERGMYFLHSSLHGASSPWECSICHKVCSDKNEFTLHFVNQQHSSYV